MGNTSDASHRETTNHFPFIIFHFSSFIGDLENELWETLVTASHQQSNLFLSRHFRIHFSNDSSLVNY
jgi:hypothetical protein